MAGHTKALRGLVGGRVLGHSPVHKVKHANLMAIAGQLPLVEHTGHGTISHIADDFSAKATMNKTT